MGSWLWGIILGIIISGITYILYKKRKSIKRLFLRNNSVNTNNGGTLNFKSQDGTIKAGAKASPNGKIVEEDKEFQKQLEQELGLPDL